MLSSSVPKEEDAFLSFSYPPLLPVSHNFLSTWPAHDLKRLLPNENLAIQNLWILIFLWESKGIVWRKPERRTCLEKRVIYFTRTTNKSSATTSQMGKIQFSHHPAVFIFFLPGMCQRSAVIRGKKDFSLKKKKFPTRKAPDWFTVVFYQTF